MDRITWTSHGVLNLSQMYIFHLLALFYIMIKYILIIYNNSTTPKDILTHTQHGLWEMSHWVLNVIRMCMFYLLALFYIMIQCISIIHDNSTNPRDIIENTRQPYSGNRSSSYWAHTQPGGTKLVLWGFMKLASWLSASQWRYVVLLSWTDNKNARYWQVYTP